MTASPTEFRADRAAPVLVDRTAELEAQRDAFRLSLVLAALENLMKFDTDATARAVYRARYLDLTDGRLPQ